MAAGDARVADLLDAVHHKMDNMVCSHHVYNCVVASNRTTTQPGGGACRPIHTMNLQWQ